MWGSAFVTLTLVTLARVSLLANAAVNYPLHHDDGKILIGLALHGNGVCSKPDCRDEPRLAGWGKVLTWLKVDFWAGKIKKNFCVQICVAYIFVLLWLLWLLPMHLVPLQAPNSSQISEKTQSLMFIRGVSVYTRVPFHYRYSCYSLCLRKDMLLVLVLVGEKIKWF